MLTFDFNPAIGSRRAPHTASQTILTAHGRTIPTRRREREEPQWSTTSPPATRRRCPGKAAPAAGLHGAAVLPAGRLGFHPGPAAPPRPCRPQRACVNEHAVSRDRLRAGDGLGAGHLDRRAVPPVRGRGYPT